jgi:hypothetical protein
MKNVTFWDEMACSRVEVIDVSKEHTAPVFHATCFTYYVTLEMEAVFSSKYR